MKIGNQIKVLPIYFEKYKIPYREQTGKVVGIFKSEATNYPVRAIMDEPFEGHLFQFELDEVEVVS